MSFRSISMPGSCLVLLLGLTVGACHDHFDFDPPANPSHEIKIGGAWHAVGHEFPFLCHSETSVIELVNCASRERPPAGRLSCDAMGCHGGYDYSGSSEGRHLRGSEGPSCYSCHEKKWEEKGFDPNKQVGPIEAKL